MYIVVTQTWTCDWCEITILYKPKLVNGYKLKLSKNLRLPTPDLILIRNSITNQVLFYYIWNQNFNRAYGRENTNPTQGATTEATIMWFKQLHLTWNALSELNWWAFCPCEVPSHSQLAISASTTEYIYITQNLNSYWCKVIQFCVRYPDRISRQNWSHDHVITFRSPSRPM